MTEQAAKWPGIEKLAEEIEYDDAISVEDSLRRALEPLLDKAEDTITLAEFLHYGDEPGIELLRKEIESWRK